MGSSVRFAAKCRKVKEKHTATITVVIQRRIETH